jgi:hypothetical protein
LQENAGFFIGKKEEQMNTECGKPCKAYIKLKKQLIADGTILSKQACKIDELKEELRQLRETK